MRGTFQSPLEQYGPFCNGVVEQQTEDRQLSRLGVCSYGTNASVS
ncbi:Protein of unknown function [Pyronema omphalodes CBS 100304]|uniref:Uncharacterized protein n=1 Tax=Pyronema omphalodes (strain CBS 100304) TaxID=1076935 RepID=U4L9X0_PYROM|nr:Protein of unknown function [Pyronema omphalodes CBS 100304]